MRKLFILLLLLAAIPAYSQSLKYVPLSVSTTGTAPTQTITGTTGYVDSIWTVLLSTHLIAGTDVLSAKRVASDGTISQFTRDQSVKFPYMVANAFTSGATVSSSAITLGVAQGGTGATTLVGAQNNLGLYAYYQPADSSTTGQTLTNSGLAFSVAVSATYTFEGLVYDSSSSSAGVKFGIDIPTGATMVSIGIGQTTGPTATNADIVTADATAGTAVTTAAGYGWYRIVGTIKTDATHNGTVAIQYLKATSGTAIIKAGSYVFSRRIS